MNTQVARELVSEFRQLKARRAERLERMRECLAGFGEVYRAAHPPPVRSPLPERMAAMGEAVRIFADLRERVRAECPADFSILGVLRRHHDELTHSCLLAWLLDPRGDHEHGALFLL